MPFFRRRTTLMLILTFVLIAFLVPVQVAQSQSNDPYTGEPDFYDMHLMPVGQPSPNLNIHYYISRPRVPPPIPVPLPGTPTGYLEPSQEARAQYLPSTKNDVNVSTPRGTICLDFNGGTNWGSKSENPSYSPWDDQFLGWGPFAVDDAGSFQVENVVFSREQTYSDRDGYSLKIASMRPYQAGVASPIIPIEPDDIGKMITVAVDYYILNTGEGSGEFVSLGVKRDAHGDCMQDSNPQCYRNGYEHGHWATLTHSVPATTTEAMVLLQAHSDSPVNSNIYFDSVTIQVGDKTFMACELDGEVK